MRRGVAISSLLLVMVSSFGCEPNRENNAKVLRLATTTSVRDSGLLDELIPPFEAKHNCRVDVVAVGTGAALKLGETGDADVLIVHAPTAELIFIENGFGSSRVEFMSNHFVILGPKADPAGIESQSDTEVLPAIARAKSKFISRGDQSGTHKREQHIWEQSGGQQEWAEYLESGQGMGATLTMADEMEAYVLSDFGTWLKFREKIELVQLKTLTEPNVYSVIPINPARHEKIEADLAGNFATYLQSKDAQSLIQNYKVNNTQLFQPNVTPKSPPAPSPNSEGTN